MLQLSVEIYNKVKETVNKLFQELGRDPMASELATELGWNYEDAEEWLLFILDSEDEQKTEEDFEIKIRYSFKNYEMEKARIRAGLLQEELAEKIGVGKATISTIESCRQYPTKERQKAIASVLNVSEERLFPEWLNVVADNIKEKKNRKIIPIKNISIEAPEVLLLESGDDLYKQAEQGLIKTRVREALNILTPKQKRIMELRLNGETLENIGKEIGVNRERIRQIEALSIEKLRCELEDEKDILLPEKE